MKYKNTATKLKSGVYKHAELQKLLGSKMAVKRYTEAGFIEKITRAFYATPDIPSNQTFFTIIAKHYKGAVISKKTILYHYKLTTDQTSAIDLDVASDSKLRNSTDLLDLHRTKKIFKTTFTKFNSVTLKCYTVERSLFEVLYFEKKAGQLTSEVIHNYLAKYSYNPSAIYEIAQKFGARGVELARMIQILAGNKFNKMSLN